MGLETLTIVAKITDQCNLGCGYCYYYAGENASLRSRKEKNTGEKLEKLANAIVESNICREFTQIYLSLHGGEPLLVPKEVLSRLLDPLMSAFGKKLSCVVQTNGVLLDEHWIEFFAERKIAIGVSIDAVEVYHNERRPFTSGKPSYNQCLNSIKALQSSPYAASPDFISTISVYDPRVSAAEYFSEIVDNWGVKYFDILIPDEGVSDANTYAETLRNYLDFIEDMWKEYNKRNDPRIHFRLFESVMKGARNYNLYQYEVDWSSSNLIIADLEGGLFFDDTLRFAMPISEMRIGNWATGGLDEALTALRSFTRKASELPAKCKSCVALPICGGGALAQRYSPITKAFDSYVHCNPTQFIYSEILNVLAGANA
ncbi:MAG: radical SAM protein [Hyphomonadaceae bacterium]